MDTINRKYKVTTQILTPLHIGAGAEKDWVEGIDYLRQGDTLYHLDMRKMLTAGIDVNQMAQMFASGKTSEEIREVVGSNLRSVSDFQMPMPCSSANPIKVFLRNQLTGNPIIAGSSLKGAIRSILFAYLREKGETTNNAVFGNLNDGSDFMRFIRVGDFEFAHNSTELVNTKIFNLEGGQGRWQGGWKHKGGFYGETNQKYKETGFNTIYECLPYGEEANGTFLVSENLFENAIRQIRFSHSDAKSKLITSSIAYLSGIINNHTKAYLKKEQKFFSQFSQAEEIARIYDSKFIEEQDIACGIPQLLGEFTDLKPNECILKMSAGSGFHSITGDWQFDDYTHGTFDRKNNKGERVLPKSRKIAITYDGEGDEKEMFLDLMGFVKLTFEEVNE